MLRALRIAASAILIFVAIVAAVVAVEHYEPTKQEAEQEAKNQGEAKAIDILASERVAYYTKVLAIFTGALSVFGLLQIYFLNRSDDTARATANAASKSADIAKQTLIVSQRPYVRVSGFPWLWRPDFGRPGKYFYDITPIIENAGNTHTVGLQINVNSALRDTTLPDDFDFPYTGPPGDSLIGARQTIGASHAHILDDDLLAIQKGEKFFFMWGTITYRAVFEGTPLYTTEFTTEINRVLGDPLDPREPGNPKGTTVEISFRVYPKHNRTD
jgi:hypothetical protein